jgi:PAS domain-containing protein
MNTGARVSLNDLVQRRSLFDQTWTLSTILATAMAVISWYFGLSQADIGPVIWTLAALAFMQFVLGAQTRVITSGLAIQRVTLSSQILGTVMMGVAWHEFGGLQQPLLPLFVVLPLLSATLLLDFWRQQVAILALLLLLASGVLLSPEANSFIQERYGLGIAVRHIPAWIPRSRVAFADVNTSPTYDLVLVSSLVVVAIALGFTGRAMVGLCSRELGRLTILESELERMQRINLEMITRSPRSEVLVRTGTGRIVMSSQRFQDAYPVGNGTEGFLLDAVSFRYPAVVKNFLSVGGEEVQAATVGGRDVMLRLSAVVIGSGTSQMTRVIVEVADELLWRGALDALEQPAFAINSRGNVAVLNRQARAMFGEHVEGFPVADLFDTGTRWWDIAPLDAARRTVSRGDQQFVAAIRREQIAESVGDVTCVYLHERASLHALAV